MSLVGTVETCAIGRGRDKYLYEEMKLAQAVRNGRKGSNFRTALLLVKPIRLVSVYYINAYGSRPGNRFKGKAR